MLYIMIDSKSVTYASVEAYMCRLAMSDQMLLCLL